jgi:hypothetical protein
MVLWTFIRYKLFLYHKGIRFVRADKLLNSALKAAVEKIAKTGGEKV